MQTAVDIPTQRWNDLLAWLRTKGWRRVYTYRGWDAGIDFDLVILRKRGQEVRMGWDNWMEGELQAPDEVLNAIEAHFGFTFTLGPANSLKPEVVQQFWKG